MMAAQTRLSLAALVPGDALPSVPELACLQAVLPRARRGQAQAAGLTEALAALDADVSELFRLVRPDAIGLADGG